MDTLDYTINGERELSTINPVAGLGQPTGCPNFAICYPWRRLQLTSVNDGGLDVGADGAGGAAESLNLLDDLHGLIVGNLTEDNVLAIEPRGDNGGDEELGAVAADAVSGQAQSSSYGEGAITYVLGPALAMERIPGLVWR